MIVRKEITDAKREAYATALVEVYAETSDSDAARAAERRYPYLQERIVTVTLSSGKDVLFKVQAEQEEDENLYVGTLLVSASARRPHWELAHIHVGAIPPDGLRVIAGLIESPLEPYVAPVAPQEPAA